MPIVYNLLLLWRSANNRRPPPPPPPPKKKKKIGGLQRDSNPWPLLWHCSALSFELWRPIHWEQANNIVEFILTCERDETWRWCELQKYRTNFFVWHNYEILKYLLFEKICLKSSAVKSLLCVLPACLHMVYRSRLAGILCLGGDGLDSPSASSFSDCSLFLLASHIVEISFP